MPNLADLARMFAQQRGAPDEMGPSLGLQNVNRGPRMASPASAGGVGMMPPRDYIPGGNVGTGQWADAGTPSWNQAPSGGMGGPQMPPRMMPGGGSSRELAAQIGQGMGGGMGPMPPGADVRADVMPQYQGGPPGPGQMPAYGMGPGKMWRDVGFPDENGQGGPQEITTQDLPTTSGRGRFQPGMGGLGGSSRDIASRIGRGGMRPGMGGGGQQQMMQQLMQMLMRGRGGGGSGGMLPFQPD